MRKRKQEKVEWITFSCLKASEGGMSKKFAMELLKMEGIRCRNGYSPYVGHYGIEVEKKWEDKAEKILYGDY